MNLIDNLDEFVGFQIMIVSSGTNEAYSKFKDLRVIAFVKYLITNISTR